MTSLKTPLCELLGIEYPIIQAGMSGGAGPELVAAVANAGGFGILPALNLAPDAVRDAVRRTRALTDRPFGVNLWLHGNLWPPADVTRLAPDTVRAVGAALNRVRKELDLPERATEPVPMADVVGGVFEVIVEERVAVFSVALGEPTPEMVRRCRERGIKIMTMVPSVEAARTAERVGADVIVAQGSEAGGHRSIGDKPATPPLGVGTLALVPQVVDAVRVPVVACGGLADGRGLVAALALGAQGVQLGTRFVATRESPVAEFRKKAILEAESHETALSDVVSGLWARYVRNRYIAAYEAAGAPVLPALVQTRAAQDIFDEANRRQDAAWLPLATGQSAGLVRDLPGAGEVIETIVREARAVLTRLAG